ncbi:MAG TPA: DUF1360 domain-containing protein [Acidimicrobiales bacterium]|nr:DUF1360 domain-containing protein [Acidimicrobiales bacterium]
MAAEAEVSAPARAVEQRYANGSERPLGFYAGAIGAYAVFVSGAAALLHRRRVPLPPRLGAADLALLAVATQQLSRTVAKDTVASPLRAPFTRFAGRAGPGEVNEDVVAEGWAHGAGELLTCPFCLSQWIATSFVLGMVVAPRATRLVASVLALRAGADALQFAYAALESAVE